MTDELKPCPFCGSNNIARSVDAAIWPDYMGPDEILEFDVSDKSPITTTVYCQDCCCQIQAWSFDWYDSINLAYEAWNKRANEKTIYDWLFATFAIANSKAFLEFVEEVSNGKSDHIGQ